MSIRDLIVIGAVLVSVPVCFVRPWVGILVWSWLGYMNPHRLTWGIAYDLPLAQVIAVVTIAGIFFSKEKKSLPLAREVIIMIMMFILFIVTTSYALNPEEAWWQFDKVWKIFLMTFLTMLLIKDKDRLMALTWVITLSIGIFGFKGGIFALSTGGAWMVMGPPETFISGNTEIGMAMLMVLPLMIFLWREESRTWLRRLLILTFALTIVAIIVTYSRGAMLGLAVVIFIILVKEKRKILIALMVTITIVLALQLLPEKWFGKMETIETYEEDTSAMMRICSWKVAYNMALERPLIGAGFNPFSPEFYIKYQPEDCPRQGQSDAHSIYFQVLAEHGFAGLAIYLGLLISTMLSLRRIVKNSKQNISLKWINSYAQMLQASIWGYMISGAFLSMSYFDLFYHFVAIVVILDKLLQEYLQEQNTIQHI